MFPFGNKAVLINHASNASPPKRQICGAFISVARVSIMGRLSICWIEQLSRPGYFWLGWPKNYVPDLPSICIRNPFIRTRVLLKCSKTQETLTFAVCDCKKLSNLQHLCVDSSNAVKMAQYHSCQSKKVLRAQHLPEGPPWLGPRGQILNNGIPVWLEDACLDYLLKFLPALAPFLSILAPLYNSPLGGTA